MPEPGTVNERHDGDDAQEQHAENEEAAQRMGHRRTLADAHHPNPRDGEDLQDDEANSARRWARTSASVETRIRWCAAACTV